MEDGHLGGDPGVARQQAIELGWRQQRRAGGLLEDRAEALPLGQAPRHEVGATALAVVDAIEDEDGLQWRRLGPEAALNRRPAVVGRSRGARAGPVARLWPGLTRRQA